MKHRVILYALGGLALSSPVAPQRGPVHLRGVVFDSLRRQPIRNAFVSMSGSDQVLTTDARGRFQFDSVLPGAHSITAQHPLLDSIGLSGLSTHTTVTDGRDEVSLSVPSFATLWGVACGRGRPPSDSGIVFGTIRDASHGAPVANVKVELSWSDLVIDKKHHVVQRRWRVETRSNSAGGYAVCGVAPELAVQLHASGDSSESGVIDLPPLATRVQRRDLLVGALATQGSDSSQRGTITGVVTDRTGQPIADARIVIDQVPAIRSDPDGAFTLRDVPTGTRQVEVFAIGTSPQLEIADVTPGATTTIAVTLQRVRQLETVRTNANAPRATRVFAAEFEARRRQGFGYLRDSTEIMKYDQFVNVLRDVPSLNVQYRGSVLSISVPDGRGKSCPPDVLIDGTHAGFNNLIDLFPKEIGGVEVYPRAAHIPPRFVPPGIQPECGMILVWTKYGLRNR
jgi:hypothetical protein